MNYNRIYEYRFQNVNHAKKQVVWKELSHRLYRNYLNEPQRILDPAGQLCEFINSVPSKDE